MIHRDPNRRFRALYKRHFRRVLRYFQIRGFSSEEAEELAQETFLRVFRNMKGIVGKTEAQEAAYINVTAATVRANELRRKAALMRQADEVSFDSNIHLSSDSTEDFVTGVRPQSPEQKLIKQEQRELERKRLYRAICELSPTKRCPLLLRLGDLAYLEIADAMQVSLNTVKTRIYEAKKNLKEKLGQDIDLPRRLEEDDD